MCIISARTRARSDETGSALAGVLAVFAVTILLAGLAFSSTVNALGFTSATLAGVQSQAAADAGVNFVVSELERGNCRPGYSDADAAHELGVASLDVHFGVVIASRASATDVWQAGCPVADSTQLQIVSTGTALAPGVAGQSRGDSRRVEAIYEATPGPSSRTITASGAAVYAYSSSGFYGSSQLKSDDGPGAVVQVRKGDASCTDSDIASTSIFSSGIIVADGSLTVGGSCQFSGNAWSLKGTTLTGSAQVHGSVTAQSIDVSGSAIVHGDAWSTDATALSGSAQVGGNLIAGSIALSGTGLVQGDAWTSGAASLGAGTWIHGHLTAASVSGGGSTGFDPTFDPGAPRPAPRPQAGLSVPPWVDYPYDPADWVGFTSQTITGVCDFAAMQTAIDSLAAGPGIIDARTCTGGVQISGSSPLELKNDLVVVANNFDLQRSAQITSASDRKLWLITPDETPDNLPTCPAGGGFSVQQSFIVDATVTAMVYSPCTVDIGFSAQWRGQLYGGTVSIGGSAILNYSALGLPGVDLSTGTPSDGTGYSDRSLLGQRLSIRDLSSRH